MPRTRLDRLRRPAHAWLTLPLALIVLITLGDLLTPRPIHLGALLVAAPAFTAAFAGPWLTGAISLLAVCAQVSIGLHSGQLGSEDVQAQIVALVAVSAVVVVFALLRSRHQKVLTQVRSVSEAAQRVVLRPLPPRLGPLRVATLYLAAEAEAQIGGDLYAAARTGSGTRLLIGDVRGNGLTAINDAASLLGAFRSGARNPVPLPDLVAYLDSRVYQDLNEPTDADAYTEGFITATLLDIPDHGRELRLISCGHPPPLLLHHGRVTPLQAARSAPPLGLAGLAPPDGYAAHTFPFEEGDVLLLYTDGITETRDRSGRFYPLAEAAARWTGGEPQELLDHIRDDLLAFAKGRLEDDAAAVALCRVPAPVG
ncbi:serine/threonine-protein phosphatase [Peterkaempfera bronchialis]|uniref:Serine/threonine-protein phosphatase n=1 Tax=Peterkaempfera bronchialis TaxID=2126346 RepID=A0A345T554_9ACTN|nr:serine/threonine-protein phosphatase [Peterkaempfera bronchialis]